MQDIEGNVVRPKLTDLEFRLVRPLIDPALSQEVTIGACEIPWRAGNLWNAVFTLNFFLSLGGHGQMWHRIDKTPAGTTQSMIDAEFAANVSMTGDKYFPIVQSVRAERSKSQIASPWSIRSKQL